jgi:single-strand DNA-binding protein
MAKQYNKTTFVGHLGSDPEMRYTPKGKPYTSFSVASNDQYTNENGETVKITTWYRCTAWGKAAEIYNQYLHKGSKVLIEGRLNPDPTTGGPRLWTGQDGSERASFEIMVKELYFLDQKNGNGPAEASVSVDDEPIY